MSSHTSSTKGKSSLKKIFGVDNEWGRPAPYVWFIIILVSSIPLMILGSVNDALSCTEQDILNGITPEQYFKEKHFTIQNAVKQCSEITEQSMLGGKIISAIMFGGLIITLKPYPFNKLLATTPEPKKERRTPI